MKTFDAVRTELVLGEVRREREAQDAKWGEQNHPLVDPVIAERPATGAMTTLRRMADEYEIPVARRAQYLCEVAARRGEVTWAHIASEEQSEFVEAATLARLDQARQEAIQAAAVWVAIVEAIDRQARSRPGGTADAYETPDQIAAYDRARDV